MRSIVREYFKAFRFVVRFNGQEWMGAMAIEPGLVPGSIRVFKGIPIVRPGDTREDVQPGLPVEGEPGAFAIRVYDDRHGFAREYAYTFDTMIAVPGIVCDAASDITALEAFELRGARKRWQRDGTIEELDATPLEELERMACEPRTLPEAIRCELVRSGDRYETTYPAGIVLSFDELATGIPGSKVVQTVNGPGVVFDEPIRVTTALPEGANERRIRGAIAFAREAWLNDGAEGETVHLLCNELERLLIERASAKPTDDEPMHERAKRLGLSLDDYLERERATKLETVASFEAWFRKVCDPKADGPHELEVNGVRYRMIFDPMNPPGEVRIAAGPTPEQQATIRIDPETGCDGTDDCPCTACVEGREYHANR